MLNDWYQTKKRNTSINAQRSSSHNHCCGNSGIVLFFMTQNTRYESNLLICKHTENSFKITYAQLTEEQTISFEKNGQASKRLSIIPSLKKTPFTSNTNLQNIN